MTSTDQHTREPATAEAPVVALPRRRVDAFLTGAGSIVVVVLLAAGGLLTWGSTFADDHVEGELVDQQIFFPPAEALEAEGRTDLLEHAGQQVTTGSEAQAYASFIKGHLDEIADGATYAEMGGPEREARAAVAAAVEAGAPDDEVAELQAEADAISAQRDSLFKGETLRGLLLSTYAWATIGRIAAIAAVVAFAGAAVMAVLVVLGVVHYRKVARAEEAA